MNVSSSANAGTGSRWAYVYSCAVVIVAYLALWLMGFRYVYGWLIDDAALFLKASATVRDWRQAFTFGVNALQPYFFLVSYLPLKLGWSLNSFELPMFGEQTGQFRALLAWSVVWHAVILAAWAWLAAKLCNNRIAAFISVVLLAASPTFILWSPLPDSRLLGMPVALPGMWLLLRQARPGGRLSTKPLLISGSLLGLAQSIHYTALYLIVPFCAVFWYYQLRQWPFRITFKWLLVFLVGCIWQQIVLEAISYFGLNIPFRGGPTASLFVLRSAHDAHAEVFANILLWAGFFANQMGYPLLIAAAVGLFGWIRRGSQTAPTDFTQSIIAWTIVVGIILLCVSKAQPLFRQTSVLQPFIFLLAADGIINISRAIAARSKGLRTVMGVILFAAVVAIPSRQALAVFHGHQALGRSLEWADQNGKGPIQWVPITAFRQPCKLVEVMYGVNAGGDATYISYFPWLFAHDFPTLTAALRAAPPATQWPSLFSTDAMWAESFGRGNPDFRTDPLMANVCVFSERAVEARLQGKPLRILSAQAESQSDGADPLNIFDQDESPDGVTAWTSRNSPGPHWIAFQLETPQQIAEMHIVQPRMDWLSSRIDELTISIARADDVLTTVWKGSRLSNEPVIRANWPAREASIMRITIHKQLSFSGPAECASIEEVLLPGFRIEAPVPDRPCNTLTIKSVDFGGDHILVIGSGLSRRSRIVVNGQMLEAASDDMPDRVVAVAPQAHMQPGAEWNVVVRDRGRDSSPLSFVFNPPVLVAVSPPGATAGQGFNLQPDGGSAISIDCDRATATTSVVFDSHVLPTVFGNEKWLTATIPSALLAKPGKKEIWLKNGMGESKRLTFVIEP